MLPCVDMSLLAFNYVLLPHSCAAERQAAGQGALPSPRCARHAHLPRADVPSHQLHVFMVMKCRSASGKPKPLSFQ